MISRIFDIDVSDSLVAANRQHAEGTSKIVEDLVRYGRVITSTKPEVIVECGTWTGASARWFARQGLEVITVDVTPRTRGDLDKHTDGRITWVTGDSAREWTAKAVEDLVGGRRAMVSLDSDHSTTHVQREIALYGRMVSAGCYLVVEDGIVRWMRGTGIAGSPLDAIEETLMQDARWERDRDVERMFRVSMFPAGWWRRVEAEQ